MARRTLETCRDWRIGARTFGYYTAAQLGLNEDGRAYEPAPFRLTRRLFKMVPLEFRRSGFLDFGCGLGRALCLARRAGFDPVFGMELASGLASIARHQLRRQGITVIQGDARVLSIPSAVRVFFLYNPFSGITLDAVVTKMMCHARAQGRCLLIAITCRNIAPRMAALGVPTCASGDGDGLHDWALYRIGP